MIEIRRGSDPDEVVRLRSELTSALATSDRRRGEVDAMAKRLEASESALADANRRAKDARILAVVELRELFLLPHDFAPGDLRDKWRSASEADRERLFMRATMDVSALHTAIWKVTQEARDEAKAAGDSIKALVDERDAAIASLRNAKASVRDLQAQLDLLAGKERASVRPSPRAYWFDRDVNRAVVRGVVLALSTWPPPLDRNGARTVLRHAGITLEIMIDADCVPEDVKKFGAILAEKAPVDQ